ncbi:MAG: dermonecrotic toxin domain-containing protein [Luteibacter jiangsuensis]
MPPVHVRTRLAVTIALSIATPLSDATTSLAHPEAPSIASTGTNDPLIASAEDAHALREMLMAAYALPAPDARAVAKQFVAERLGLDSDAYVVAHFADARSRGRGEPDHTTSLTEALMEAFPEHSRHTFFAEAADAVGGITAGGRASPGIISGAQAIFASDSPRDFFRKAGAFLWSRTGPGYIYNTFIARGNVVDTVREDHRHLDEAFGVFRPGGYTSAHLARLTLSQIVDAFAAPTTFAELPYVTRLDNDVRKYWAERGNEWHVLARYHFVREARRARADCAGTQCVLSEDQYRQIMSAAAAGIPLHGPVTMAQLRQASPAGPGVRRLDINGYPASDIVRFVLDDKSEVIYIPGGYPSFVVAHSEEDLWRWVFDQSRDPGKISRLLSHFSLANAQDTFFWTGVRHGLEKIGSGQWQPNGDAIDRRNAVVDGDVFQDMRVQTEQRMRADARTQSSTAWEGWRDVINRTTVLLGPLGYVPALAIPVQLGTAVTQGGTGLELAIDGRTEEQRKQGLEQAATVALTAPIAAPSFAGFRKGHAGDYLDDNAGAAKPTASFVPPREVNGQLGYLLGPRRPPRLPEDRLYVQRDGTVDRWIDGDTGVQVTLSADMREGPDGIFRRGSDTYVRWKHTTTERPSVVKVSVGEDGPRLTVASPEGPPYEKAGPLVTRLPDGTWDIADVPENNVKGAVLGRFRFLRHAPRGHGDTGKVGDRFLTDDPQTLNRAAEIMEQLGMPEAELSRLPATEAMDSPVAALAIVHAFVENLPRRLRNPHARSWTGWEARIIAPVLAKAVNRPIALYEGPFLRYTAWHDGRLVDAAEGSAARPPDNALRLTLREGKYHVADATGFGKEFGGYIKAIAWGAQTPSSSAEASEPALREAMASELENRSRMPELKRAEREWIPADMPDRAGLLELSHLRLRLTDPHETPEARDYRQMSWAGTERPDAGAVATALKHLIQTRSGLLPGELDFLVVNDPAMDAMASTRGWGDDWSAGGRHYVRLRDLYGHSQVVRTSHTDIHGHREIRWPGNDPEWHADTPRTPGEPWELDLGQVRHVGSRWIAADSPAGRAHNLWLESFPVTPLPPLRPFAGPHPSSQPDYGTGAP